jgi:hypothetical protein
MGKIAGVLVSRQIKAGGIGCSICARAAARGTAMVMVMATRPPPSVLLVRRWAVAPLGNLSVREATTNDGFSVQEAWESGWPAGWTNAHWSWPRILQRHDERFALIAEDDRVLGLWCGRKPGVLHLSGIKCYQPTYLERAPLLAPELAPFLFTLIAARARELGATAMVLGALDAPGICRFYEAAGGQRRGWPKAFKAGPNLVPYFFDSATLQDLEEMSDAFRV